MRRLVLFGVITLSLSCTAVQRQKSLPPQPDDLQFHNLQVLPLNISHDELIETMRHFTRALGVKCGHCHVQVADTGNRDTDFDFPSDAKPHKADARVMIRMTSTINSDYISKVPEIYTTVTCWTCHRGQTQPDIRPSVPPEEKKP